MMRVLVIQIETLILECQTLKIKGLVSLSQVIESIEAIKGREIIGSILNGFLCDVHVRFPNYGSLDMALYSRPWYVTLTLIIVTRPHIQIYWSQLSDNIIITCCFPVFRTTNLLVPTLRTLTSTMTLMNCNTAVSSGNANDVITVNSSHPSVTRISCSLLDYMTHYVPSVVNTLYCSLANTVVNSSIFPASRCFFTASNSALSFPSRTYTMFHVID